MRIRNLLVATAAAAILAGSSMAASAGGYSFHKPDVGHATSSSGVLSVGIVIYHTPVSGTLQSQHNSSYATGSQGAAASAATNGAANTGYVGGDYTTAASGATSGASCAGSACH